MPYSLIDSVLATPGGSGGSTSAIDTTGADLLIVAISEFSGGTHGAPTDSKGNTWDELTTQEVGNVQLTIFYAKNPTVGSGHTFTYSNTNVFPSILVMAFSGADLTDPFDQENGNTGNISQPGSVTPTEDDSLVIAAAGTPEVEPGAVSIGSSFTLELSSPYLGSDHTGGFAAYKVQTTAAAENPTWTNLGLGVALAIATFKAAAAGDTFTATAAVTVPFPTLTGTATHTPPSFTATAALTVNFPTLAATGTATGPSFDAAAALTVPFPTLAASGTHDAPVFTGTAALAVNFPTLAGTGTHDAPVFSATAALTVNFPSLAGTATHDAPVFTASAAVTVPFPALAGTGLFANNIFIGMGTFTCQTPTFAGTATFEAAVGDIPVSGRWVAGWTVRRWVAAGKVRKWVAGRSQMTKNTVTKTPGDALVRLTMDFAGLPEFDDEGDEDETTISSVTSIAGSPSGLTIGSSQIEASERAVSAVFSGGTAGTDYQVTFTVLLSTGQTIARTGLLQVRTR